MFGGRGCFAFGCVVGTAGCLFWPWSCLLGFCASRWFLVWVVCVAAGL